MHRQRQQVLSYYERRESRIGYEVFLRGHRHFGYYEEDQCLGRGMQAAQDRMKDLVALALELPPGGRVLDAGCGSGAVTSHLATHHGLQLVGVDLAASAMMRSTRRVIAAGVEPRPQFARMDYSAPAFRDAAFDGIFTMETLVHVPDHRSVLEQFRRMLRPGGSVVLNEYSISPASEWPERDMQHFAALAEASGTHGLVELEHGTMEESLDKAGFVDISHLDTTANVRPMWRRFYHYAALPALLARLIHLERRFERSWVNGATAYQVGRPGGLLDSGLFRHNIYAARRPSSD